MADIIKPPTEERFKNNLLDLCQLLKDIVLYIKSQGCLDTFNPVLMDLGINFVRGIEAKKIIHNFIDKSYIITNTNSSNSTETYWDKIRMKDEEFLRNNLHIIFGMLPADMIKIFSDILNSKNKEGENILKKETWDSIWVFMDALIKGSIRYIHETRIPEVVDGKKKYTIEYFPQISISTQVKLWNIKNL